MATDAGHRRAVKAVIPAAGMATRFLPATKAVPKELLPETDAAGGAVVGQRLCDAVRSAPMLVPPRRLPPSRRSPMGRRVPVTVSVGVAVFPEHGSSGTVVLQAADDALYAAKADGRDTYRVAQPLTRVVAGTGGGASGSPQPPRQSRGR